MLLRWLHRWINQDAFIGDYLTELPELLERSDYNRQWIIRQAEEIADLRAVIDTLTTPGSSGKCSKVQYRSEEVADGVRQQILRDTNKRLEPYKCGQCPRQPGTMEKFWHLRTVAAESTPAAREAALRRRQQLATYIADGVQADDNAIEKLKSRFNNR